jgi:hypothetical protein
MASAHRYRPVDLVLLACESRSHRPQMKSYLPMLGLLPLILLPAFWFGIMQLFSLLGGWRTLARRYSAPPDSSVPARVLTMQSGKIGLVSYRNALTVAFGPDGLHLSTFMLMRPGHPPLIIPWNAFQNREERSMLWYKGVRFEVGPDRVRVELPARVLEESPLSNMFSGATTGFR